MVNNSIFTQTAEEKQEESTVGENRGPPGLPPKSSLRFGAAKTSFEFDLHSKAQIRKNIVHVCLTSSDKSEYGYMTLIQTIVSKAFCNARKTFATID